MAANNPMAALVNVAGMRGGEGVPLAQALASFGREDPKDYSAKYNTALSDKDEKAYQQWAVQNNRQRDVENYDMRGAWSAGLAPNGEVHSPDTYKKPNHPTFSNQSIYNGEEGVQGGVWGMDGGRNHFTPSPSQMWDQTRLQKYFADRESTADLRPVPFD